MSEPIIDGYFVFSADSRSARRDHVIVELTDETNESLRGGDYDDSDPTDAPALRMYVHLAENWRDPLSLDLGDEIDDGSYCTRIHADTNPVVLRRILRYMLDTLLDAATITHNAGAQPDIHIPKRVLEDLSWISGSEPRLHDAAA